ncbi:MAG: hypothetical protein ACI8Z1_002482 [Candidatus Azotimanducaceae bacterium]
MKARAALLICLLSNQHSIAKELVETSAIVVRDIAVTTERSSHQVLITDPFSVRKGDLVDVRFQVEVTSHNQLPVIVGWEVRLTTDPDNRPGHLVIGSAATNLKRETHHQVISGTRVIPMEHSLQNVQLVLSLWSQRRALPASPLVVETNGPFLQALIEPFDN